MRKDRRTQSNEDEVKYVLEVKSFVIERTARRVSKTHRNINQYVFTKDDIVNCF